MRLIITRHGETEENKLGVMMGHNPGTLSKEGIEQAKKAALRLKDEKIDFIYSSDLKRASDTAKEIAKFHKDVPLIFTEELRERYLGEFQGRKPSDFGIDPKNFKATIVEPKNGEKMQDLFNRAQKFLQNILKKHQKDTVCLVSHNGFNKALIAVITNKKAEDIISIDNQHNTSINVFEINKNKEYKVLVSNSIDHLN